MNENPRIFEGAKENSKQILYVIVPEGFAHDLWVFMICGKGLINQHEENQGRCRDRERTC